MKNKNITWFVIGTCITLSAAVLARIEPWNYVNSPDRLNTGYQKHFFSLPKAAEVAQKPWSDTYWPSDHGGLAWRWYTPNGVNESSSAINYNDVNDYRALLQMSKEQLARLSPIEKFDIYLGNIYPNRPNYYRWFKKERQRTIESGRSFKGWEGLCHGWAVASVNHVEPARVLAPVTIIDERDGQSKQIMLPFLSSDIKALLTYYYASLMDSSENSSLYKIVGLRCNGNATYTRYIREGRRTRAETVLNDDCRDVNAGTFHIALTNQVGIQRQSFIADLEGSSPVWNHPITGYKSRWLQERRPSASASNEAVREIVVETTITYMVEVNPYASSFKGWDWLNAQNTKTYQYSVELNAADQIVGGEWLSSDHPDFLWTMGKQPFTGDFSILKDLFIPAQ